MNNSNKSSNWTKVDYTNRADWIVPIVVHVFLVFSMVWIILSLVHFGIKNKKWQGSMELNNFEKLSSGLIYSSVLLCATICLLRYIITLTVLNVGYEKEDDYLCSILSDLQSCFYALVQMSVLFFLWLRQRAFYTNAMLAVSYTRTVRSFSLISIALILISAVGITVFSTLPDDRRSSPNGCVYESDGSSRVGYWVFLALVIIFVHGILFGLFYHAIRRSGNFNKRSGYSLKQKSPKPEEERSSEKSQDTSSKELNQDLSINSPPKTVSSVINSSKTNSSPATNSSATKSKRRSSNKPRKSKHPIKKTLQKTFLFAIISVTADIFLSVVWLFIKVDGRILVTFYNVNALFSLLLVIFSFPPYKKMLFSFL